MDLHSAYAKHELRVVVVFTAALASGAFGVSPTAYFVASLDSKCPNPVVRAALVVPGDPNTVELALGTPMATGGQFRLTASAVPAVGGGTASGTADFVFAAPFASSDAEKPLSDAEALLYGSDILWNGTDFEETAAGDLAAIEGPRNVSKALYRRCTSSALGWDESYGANPRAYVDSPVGASGTLRGTLATQCMRDPRIKKVEVRTTIARDTSVFDIVPTLVSGAAVAPVTVKVPNG